MQFRLFCTHEDDDYRIILKNRRVLFVLAAIAGGVTMAVSLLLAFFFDLKSYASGYYCGSGAAVLAIGIYGVVEINRTLKNEARLRTDRIKETDERTREISQRAAAFAVVAAVLIFYVALLVTILISHTVFFTLLAVLCVFLFLYLGATFYYKRTL